MLTLVLTRHGATDRSNPEQHLGQRIDIPLSEAGRAAARALGRRLEGVRFDRIVASPLRRAQETARLALPAADVETDARLAEMDYGEWEGLAYEQIAERDGERRRAWEEDPEANACPGGESGADVARRVQAFLADAIARSSSGAPERDARAEDAGEVLVVAHSTTNRVLLAVALHVPVREYRRRFQQEPANLTVLRFPGSADEGALLLLGDDVSHVRGTRGATWDEPPASLR
jgi:broad specificity phosphatase PhoE